MEELKPEFLCERAVGHMVKGQYSEATLLLEEALSKAPKYADAWSNRGLCLIQLGHPFDAILQFEKAIALKPNSNPEYYGNCGVAYYHLDNIDKAIEFYFRALQLNPKDAPWLTNMGNALKRKRKLEAAIEYYRKAIEVDPDGANGHLMLSTALLENGEYEEGWKEYEWRWKSDQLVERGLPYPKWEGEPLEGKRLIVYSEQGFGDCLQFVRYARVIKEKFGGTIIVEVRQPLARLIETVPGIDAVHIFGDKLPGGIDYCLPMMSAPRICKTTVDTIPWFGPYFNPEQTRIDVWNDLIEKSPLPKGLRVGICWAGMSRPGRPEADAVDRKRSTTLASFSHVAQVPDIGWVSLQKGPPTDQIQRPPNGMTIGHWMDECDDFYDTAALIKCLDLVITVDTAVAHVAAGLGVPTWVLSRFDGCWRWLGQRSDSPWYPSVRQFWQPKPGDWDTVMKQVATALKEFEKEKQEAA